MLVSKGNLIVKIEADAASVLSQEKNILITHKKDQGLAPIRFQISLYKQDIIRSDETFASINAYWDSLPENEQDAVFSIYEDIRELFDSVRGLGDLNEELVLKVADLMSYHSTAKIEKWIVGHSNLRVPASIDRDYKFDVDKNTTRDQTYIYNDYLGLMALSIAFRAMIPIWSVYNKTARSDSGKIFKDQYCFRLLKKSCIEDSEPLARLRRYVTANLSNSSHTGNHTLEFICSDDMPDYNLALVCVRKLCLGELRPEDNKQNLAALVYNFIIDRPSPNNNDFSKRVLEKEIPKEAGGETGENNGSTLEIYKARSTITVGRIGEMEYPWRDPHNLALQLAPNYDPKQLDRALQTVRELYKEEIRPCIVQLSQWVVGPVFPAMGHFYMEPEIILKSCALAETVLWTRGFKFLALLASAFPLREEEEGSRVTPIGTKSHISQAAADRLSLHFPYVREITKRSSEPVRHCFVTEDIKNLSSKFMEDTWRASADISMVQEVLNSKVRRIPIHSSLRNDLATMLSDSEDQFS